MTKFFNEAVQKLLLDRNVTIISNVSDDLKCVVCKNILINACQTDCGCNFCKKCIEDYKTKGMSCCPGNTNHCQYNNLSNVTIDHRTNRQISQLIVRCGNANCHFDCELMNMESHMETCSKKKVNCPFKIIGCEEKMTGDKINDHLQLDNPNHSKLLLEMINNLRNEVKELKKKEKENTKEILTLKMKIEDQEDEIRIIKSNVDFNTNAIEDMSIEINNVMTKVSNQVSVTTTGIEEKNVTMEDRNNEEFETLNMSLIGKRFAAYSRNKDAELNENETVNVKNKLRKIFESMNGENNTSLSMKMEKVTTGMNQEISNDENEMNMRVNKLEKFLDLKNKTFVWNIGVIFELEINRHYYSNYFYHRNNPYKMGLLCWMSFGDLFIRLLIYNGPSDVNLCWPFKADVTIKIANNRFQNQSKSITQSCVLNRPKDNRYKCSDRFLFKKLALLEIESRYSCVIECNIDFKK